MRTIYIKLKLIEGNFAELRYALEQPAKYETQKVNLSAIQDLIQKAKGSYYMLLPDLKGMGQQLFYWLDGNGRWLSRAIANCNEEGLILAIDSSEGISHLPWEVLHDGTQFLIERNNPVVVPLRWVDSPSEENYSIQARPLRILFMATAPENVAELDFEREEAQILAATQDIPLLLRVEESGCISELGKLWGRYREPFDIFHLTGHASIQNNQPYFVTETEIGEHYAATANEIVAALRFRLPQLVFLSGCRTGESPSNGAVPSLALSLVQQGCKAVLGWARPVNDLSATVAAAHIYSKLAAGYKLSEALASTYQYLHSHKIQDWHLLRLYVRGRCPDAFLEPLGDEIWIPNEPIYEQFLDPEGKVRVATPQEFVGRRRVLQHSLKALKSSDKLGIILYGLGGVGKSTVAARLLERLPAYNKIFIYKELDENKLLNLLGEQCFSEAGQEILQGKLPLIQRLTKFLCEGLNQTDQRFIFVLDDFEENLELRPDGKVVLKVEAVEVLNSLLKAIFLCKLPHRVIITSRYDFQLPELNNRLYRELLTSLSGGDLKKKCNRLRSFSSKSDINPELLFKAQEIADGNPRLLEWLDKILQADNINHARILESMEKAAYDFRESILAEELLKQQPANLKRMLAYSLVYRLPVPKSAIVAICPQNFNLDDYILRSISLGLLEISNYQSETLYRVPRILEPFLDFPKDSQELHSEAAKYLHECWFLKGFIKLVQQKKPDEEYKKNIIRCFEVAMPEMRLMELYRIASIAEELEILISANWMLVVRWNEKGLYRAIVMLCQLTLEHGVASFRLFYYLAKAEEKIGEIDSCQEHYKTALSLVGESNKLERAAILHDLASLYESQGNNDKALKFCLQAIEIDEKDDKPYAKYRSLGLLASIKHNQGKREEALSIYQKAYQLTEQSGDINYLFILKSNIAILQVELGKVDAWNNILMEVLDNSQNQDNPRDMLIILNNIAMSKKVEGKLQEAGKIYQEVMHRLSTIDDIELKGSLLINLATLCSEQGQQEEALCFYQQALKIHKKNKSPKWQAITLREIGVIYQKQKDFLKAVELLEESYKIDESIGNIQGQADSLWWLASILLQQEQFEEALPKLKQAFEIYEDTQNFKGQSRTLIAIGSVYNKRGRLDEAIDFVQQAWEISKLVIDVQEKAVVLTSLGLLLTQKGEFDKALLNLQQAFDIYSSFNPQEAEDVRKHIIATKWNKVNALNQKAGERATQGNYKEALIICEQALEIAEEIDHFQGKAGILFLMSQILIETDFYLGLQKLKNAIDISQELKISENELMQQFLTNVLNDEITRLCKIAQDELKLQNIEETISLLEKALILATDNNDLDWQRIILVFLGQVIAAHKNYEQGINHLKKALELAKKDNFEDTSKIQDIISVVQNNEVMQQFQTAYSTAENGQIEESINLLLKSLYFQRSISHVKMQISTLGLIGQLFEYQGSFQEALVYLQEALEMAQELQSEENIEIIHRVINRIISL